MILTRCFIATIARCGTLAAVVATVPPAAALTITPLFDSSISGASDSSEVESAIDTAIGTIDSLYSNSGTMAIVFTQEAGSFLGQSEAADYYMSYGTYTSALSVTSAAEPTNTVLSTAVANLYQGNMPGSGGSMVITTADARIALGISASTPCFNSSGNYVAGCGQLYDGVVTLSTTYPLNYTKTPVNGEYSAIAAMEHELNEMLGGGGQGSVLNEIADGQTSYVNDRGALDLYRYSAPGTPSFSTSGGASSYFSVNGGNTNIVCFNQNSNGDYADFCTNNNIQSAFTNSGDAPAYNQSSPEFTMMESIGYDGAIPEPASLALLASGIVGLRTLRRRRPRGATHGASRSMT